MPEMTLPKPVKTIVDETTEIVSKSSKWVLDASRGAFNMTVEEAEQLIDRGEDLVGKLIERGQNIEVLQLDRLGGIWKSWSERGHKQLDVAEEQVEQSVQKLIKALNLPTADDVKRLDMEIDRISKKLDAVIQEKKMAAQPGAVYGREAVESVTAPVVAAPRARRKQAKMADEARERSAVEEANTYEMPILAEPK